MPNSSEPSRITIDGYQIPWFELAALNNNNAQTIHFAAANGFPIACYDEFFACFAGQYRITGMDCRATWQPKITPPKRFSIDDFADDLIHAIKNKHSAPVIGMGHSHGGLMTLVAAAKRPELFSKLVIIEPAAMPMDWLANLTAIAPRWLIYQLFPFIKGSLERQALWPSRDAFYQRYHGHPTFKRFTDRALADYTQHGLRKLDNGQFELVFSPAWEAHIFCTLKLFWNYLSNISLPTLLIRGEHSNLNTQKSFANHHHRLKPQTSPMVIQGAYHMIPQENPIEVHGSIDHWLKNQH